MTNTVLIKRSGTANSVPVAGNLSLGELALNYADGNLFYKNSGGAVTVIASNKFSSVTGNVTANNGMFTNIVNVASHTGAVVSVTGNVTGGNITTGGLISGTNNLIINAPGVGEGGQLVMAWANTPNVSGQANQTWNFDVDSSNVLRTFYQNAAGATSVLISANPASNIVSFPSTAGISATGNVTGSYFIGNGSQLTGISGGGGTPSSIVNGTSNVVAASSGNVTVGVAGTPNIAIFATTGEYVTGLISATGNVVANNGIFTNIVNVASHTGAVVSVTGNITANNGIFTNIVNVASHTGAVVSVTGNITGGNVSGTLLTGTLATATQTNITSVGTLGALAVSGNVTAGNVTAGSGTPVPSGSVLFNGTTQVLTIPDNAVFEMSGDFTLEAWFYRTATTIDQADIITKGASGFYQPYSVYVDSSNNITFKSSSTGTSWDVANAVTFGSTTGNVWNHVAVSRSGTAIRLFLNGSLNATITNGNSLYNNTYAVGIGARSDATELFKGYISTARIVKGVAVYTSAFTPATAPLTSTQSANQNGSPSAAITGTSTSLLLNTANGAGFLTDSSSYNFTVTNVGTATSQALTPFVSTSGTVTSTYGIFTASVNTASFTGAVVSVTGNVTGNYFVGNGSLLTGIASGTPSSIVNGTSNVVAASSGNVSVGVAGTPNVAVFATTGEYVTGLISATGNVVANNGMFTNIVNVASHTGGLVSVTGNVTANNGMFTNIVNVASHTGAVVSVTGNVTGGNLNTTGTLSTSGNVTANNGMFTNIVNVASHTGAVVSVTGNVTGGNVSAAGAAYVTGSVLLNGSTQYLSLPSANISTIVPTGTENFTLEFWFNKTAAWSSSNQTFFGGSAVSNSFQLYINVAGGIIRLSSYSVTVVLDYAYASLSANTWYHMAWVRSGNNFTLYVNGTSVATSTVVISFASASSGYIGTDAGTANFLGGYISNFRVVKGVAVYTGNFTPATAPLTSTQSANVNGTPSAAITGTSTALLLNTANNASFLTDSSTNNFTVTNVGTATSNSLAPFVPGTSGSVTATYGIFTTSVNTASFTGAVVSVTGNVTGNYFVGNGSQLTGIVAGTASSIANGTSNIAISSSSNISMSVAGAANTVLITSGSLTIAGVFAVPKTLSSNAVVAGNTNALLLGPFTLASGYNIVIPDSSTVYVYPP